MINMSKILLVCLPSGRERRKEYIMGGRETKSIMGGKKCINEGRNICWEDGKEG